jgi:NB-ARC domain/Tetratricopeptide repeat
MTSEARMTGIVLPGEERLPPGPHRVLVEALHELYRGAGLPGLRRIAAGIRDGDYRDTISHEKIGALLRGTSLPGWLKVECVVRQLAAWNNPRLDPGEQAARFITLWLAADRARRPTGARRAADAAADGAGEAAERAVAGWPGQARLAGDAPSARGGGVAEDGMLPGSPDESGLSVVRGRDGIIHRLFRGLDPQYCPGRPQVLAGPGGIGKSAIACSVAARARAEGLQRRVWWVSAADEERLSNDLARLARDLGVSEADRARLHTRAVADLGDIADQVWDRLERGQPGWLLVIDNADDPGLLGPRDQTAWIRSTARGIMLITTRDSDKAHWPGIDMFRIGPLPPQAAAQVLADLAPAAGDQTAARALARRLGYHPLALRIAGIYLRQQLGSGHTFDEYQHALDDLAATQIATTHQAPDSHAAADGTQELTLDALGQNGYPQARPLLWLLACYAPASLIPEEIITSGGLPVRSSRHRAEGTHPLEGLLSPSQPRPAAHLAEYCRTGLQELQSAGLIDRSKSDSGQKVIQVHASIAEDARAVMKTGPVPPDGPEPSRVRAGAAAAICMTARMLDTGSAEHWPRFRVLTPHADELLAHTAPHLGLRARRDLLTCMVRCIASHIWSKAEQRAEQLAVRALALADELGCRDHDVYLRLRHIHAWARREQGWLAEAEKSFHDILAQQMRMKDAATRLDTLRTRQQLAWTQGRLGRWPDAEVGLRQVLQLLDDRRRQRGAEVGNARILRLHTRCMTNWCVGRQGRWAEAEQGYRQLITDREEILGSDHPDTLDARECIGKALAWQGKWAAAENEWRHTTSDRAQILGEQHPDTILTRQLQLYAGGYQAWQNGDRAARRLAVAGLEMVLAAQREKRGDSHRETIETRAFLATLRGDYSPEMMWPEDLPRPGASEP